MARFNFKKGAAASLTLALSVLCAVSAAAAELPESVVPSGEVIGISVCTDGVMVAELSEIETDGGAVCPAKDAGLLPGDIITMIDGTKITSADDLLRALSAVTADKLTVQFERDGELMQRTVTPCRVNGDVFIGIWVRDTLNGIGTMTFYDPESGLFGALGHSISDAETGEALPYNCGALRPAVITGIVEGKAGAPGQLAGTLDLGDTVGEILLNSPVGIFGYLTDAAYDGGGEALPVASRSEIKTGAATILSGAGGEVREYAVEITRVYPSSTDGRSMMLKVTDADLLALTGGIVQGMSGSPIIQNGKIIGAVTHVLINDPAKGYGVSIEEMLDAGGSIVISDKNAA